MCQPDWSRTSRDYAAHRKGFPRLSRLAVAAPGRRVLDLGTGTGCVALGLGEWGADVVGLDIAPAQIDAARRSACERGLDIDFRVASAEATGLSGGSFDAVVAESVVAKTLEVLAAHRRSCPDGDTTRYSVEAFYPRWLADSSDAGFAHIESFSFDPDVSYIHEGWRGRMRASAWVGASLTPEEVDAFDRDLARVLVDWPDPLDVPHRVFVVHGTKPRG